MTAWAWLLCMGTLGVAWAAEGLEARLAEARSLLVAGQDAQALDAYVALGAEPLPAADEGVVFNNTCVALCRLGRAEEAVTACERALSVRRAAGDRAGEAKTLGNLGWALRLAGDLDRAEDAYVQALAITEADGLHASGVITLDNLGTVALAAGDYDEALRRYERAEALAGAHADEPWAAGQRITAVLNQGAVLEKQARYREALARYDRLEGEGLVMSPEQQATSLVNRGALYRNLEDPTRAAELYAAAAERFAGLGRGAREAAARLNLGLLRLDNLADPGGAVAELEAARALFLVSSDDDGLLAVDYHLGRALTAVGQPERALALHGEGLARADTLGSAEGRWTHAHGQGVALEALGRLDAADAALQTALDGLDALHARLEDARVGGGFLADKRRVFDAALRVRLAQEAASPGQGHVARAFEVVQRAKARDLLETLGTAEGLGRPLDAAAVSARLGPATLVEVYVGADRVVVFTVTAVTVQARDAGARAGLVGGARAVLRAVRARRPLPEDALNALSQALLADVGGAARVWFAPDGALSGLPVELLTPPGEDAPLGTRRTVTWTPSGSALPVPAPVAEGEALAAFVGFAAPTPGVTPAALRGEPLGDLTHTRHEVERAAGALDLPSRLRFGGEASPTGLLAALAEGAAVLHVATHTVFQPLQGAALLLSPERGRPDGLLTARDVAATASDIPLVVLASCRSALPGEDDGSVLGTLAGAFLASGAHAVVASLWDVDDAATEVFMGQLYHELGQGVPPARALRTVKARLRAQPGWEDPYLWAGFVLVGDTGPVVPLPTPWWVIAVVGALTLGVAAWRTRSEGPRGASTP